MYSADVDGGVLGTSEVCLRGHLLFPLCMLSGQHMEGIYKPSVSRVPGAMGTVALNGVLSGPCLGGDLLYMRPGASRGDGYHGDGWWCAAVPLQVAGLCPFTL